MNPIRQLRAQAGITQTDLAELGGTSQPTIALYEADRKSPTVATLSKLAKSLGLEPLYSFVPPLTREDRRSLAYHLAVVEKLKENPEDLINKARQNLRKMSRTHPHATKLFDQWMQWLNSPLEDLIHICLDGSLLARDMRQVTPFSGILSAKERLEILKKLRRGTRA